MKLCDSLIFLLLLILVTISKKYSLLYFLHPWRFKMRQKSHNLKGWGFSSSCNFWLCPHRRSGTEMFIFLFYST